MRKKTLKSNISRQTKDIPGIVRFAGAFFVILFTLGLFSNTRLIKVSTKSQYSKLQFGAWWECLQFCLLHQEKQI